MIPDSAPLRPLLLRPAAPRGALRRLGRLSLVLVIGLLLPSLSRAADTDEVLSALEPPVANVVQKANDIQDQLQPGHGVFGTDEAQRRYEQHLYEFLLGDYHHAAEGFFTLVTTNALKDKSEHLDAEWYLAESLFELGNYDTAESRFQAIAQDMKHPFREDAVRRLLELYARSGQTEKFRSYFQLEILSGHTKPSDIVTYTVGKTLWIQGDRGAAKTYFSEIKPESSLYGKASYMLGTIYVQQNELDAATASFRKVLDLSVKSQEDRQVLDLSLLAIGRIAYEKGDFQAAADAYGRIGGDSRYQSDTLYENVWTYIKQKEYNEALRAVDIFLLAYPDDPNAAQLQLLQGHLKMAQTHWDDALVSYEKVIADYTPVRERFAELARAGENPGDVFNQITAMEQNGVTGGGDLPPFALAKLAADPDVAKAMGVWKEVQRQQATVTESEEIIGQLNQVLSTDAHIGAYDQLYLRISDVREQALRQRMEIMAAEESWLMSSTPGAKRGPLQTLRKRREAISDAVNAAAADDTVSWDRLQTEVNSLHSAYGQARGGAGGQYGPRFDAMDAKLVAIEAQLVRAKDAVAGVQAQELARIRERLEYETIQVQAERTDLDRARTETDRVSLGLTRAGFARLEQFFADSVLKADMGVVDVYWAEKVEVSDRRTAMAQRETDLLKELNARFDLIRQKLPAEPLAAPGTAPDTKSPDGKTPEPKKESP